MTVTKKYSTPNCVLVLEGLNDGTNNSNNNNNAESQNPISALLNAECRFTSSNKTIKGSLNFFESLLNAVNNHAQECLSELHRPLVGKDKNNPQLVSIEKLSDRNYHRLTVQPEPDSNREAVSIDLNPVQMFDLVEVIDQFYADRAVLPNLSPKLEPASKRYRKDEEPAAQRAIPVSLGIGGLALAAGLMVMMPLPQVRKPETTTPIVPTQTTPNSNKLPTPPVVPNKTPENKTPENKTNSATPQATTTPAPKATTTPTPKVNSSVAPTPKATTAPAPKVNSTVAPTPKATTTPQSNKPTNPPTSRTKTAQPEKP